EEREGVGGGGGPGSCGGRYRAGLAGGGAGREKIPAGGGFVLTVRAKNTSIEPWTFRPGAAGGVRLRYQLFTFGGEPLYKGSAGHVERTVPPSDSIDLAIGFPPQKPGWYTVHADLLDTGPIDLLAADFGQYGSEPPVVTLAGK